jgi:hypothetical protein
LRAVAIILLGCFAIGCAAVKYPGYQYVRIEKTLPDAQCKYLVQEACPRPTALEGCLNWYKKRATRYDANTVVLTGPGLAEYYDCRVPDE